MKTLSGISFALLMAFFWTTSTFAQEDQITEAIHPKQGIEKVIDIENFTGIDLDLVAESCEVCDASTELTGNRPRVSRKGRWSKRDINRAKKELNSERASMEALIGKKKTDLFIRCALVEIEMNYRNFEHADSDIPGMEKIGERCMRKLL